MSPLGHRSTEATFLAKSSIYKGETFRNNSVPDMLTHFKPTKTFQSHQDLKNFINQTLQNKYVKRKFKTLNHNAGSEVNFKGREVAL